MKVCSCHRVSFRMGYLWCVISQKKVMWSHRLRHDELLLAYYMHFNITYIIFIYQNTAGGHQSLDLQFWACRPSWWDWLALPWSNQKGNQECAADIPWDWWRWPTKGCLPHWSPFWQGIKSLAFLNVENSPLKFENYNSSYNFKYYVHIFHLLS